MARQNYEMSDLAASKHKAGRKYAEQENGALAGMAEMPEVPAGCDDDGAFEAGYHQWLENQEDRS